MTEIVGTSEEGTAVFGDSVRGKGVAGVSSQNVGIFGKGAPAGRFEGDVFVDGTITVVAVEAGGNIAAVGDITAQSNLGAGGDVNAFRNVNVGETVNTTHVIAVGNVSALGNVNADRHIVAKGNIGAVGNLNANQHIVAHGNISAVGNVNAGETVNTRHIVAQGNISAVGNVNAGETVNSKHVVAQGNISAIGNVNAHNMNVAGDILLANSDCAEEFDVDAASGNLAPGTVVVLADEGRLSQSTKAYDKCVAGVVSGGAYKPAIILGSRDSTFDRVPVALMGTVYCNVDARMSPVEIGDLLTTSDTPGHAMKALDVAQAFGAVLGKALRPLPQGRGLIPILVALQ